MLNTTIFSLNVFSMLSTSPLYMIKVNFNGPVLTSFYNSQFSHTFTSSIASFTTHHKTIIKKTIFSYSMDTPVFISSANCGIDDTHKIPDPFKDITVDGSKLGWENSRAFFLEDCGDVEIYYSTFKNCFSKNVAGGSLCVQQQCTVVLHGVTFSNSKTSHCRGGAVSISKSSNTDCGNSDSCTNPNDEMLTQLTAQYCCFSNCYPQTNDTLFGVALFASAENTTLFFASTVDCPKANNEAIPKGAQFDIAATNVKSKNVNITGGKAHFCAGIEYRQSHHGFFKFQTISNIAECMFATAYSSGNLDDLEISYSNFFNNFIRKIPNDYTKYEGLDPGLVHIIKNSIVIDHFYFKNFKGANYPKIVSRGLAENGKQQEIYIYLNNCYFDSSVGTNHIDNTVVNGKTMLFTKDIVFNNDQFTTLELEELDLGDCKGVVKPTGDVTLEPVFEATMEFTQSDAFTKTDQFTFTKDFTISSQFTRSSVFTDSFEFGRTHYFTASRTFTPSITFTPSSDFSESGKFSNSLYFSNSFHFTKSAAFSKSNLFSASLMGPKNIGANVVKKDKNLGVLVGAPVAAVAAAALIAAAIFFFIRHRKLNAFDREDADVQNNGETELTTINPLYSKADAGADDPFAEDFIDDD